MSEIRGQKSPIFGLKLQKSLNYLPESDLYPQILVFVGRKVCYDKLRQDPDSFSLFYTPLEGKMGENWGQKSPFFGLKVQKLLNYLLGSNQYPQIFVVVGRNVCYE